MKISARNKLAGKVSKITIGAVNAEVIIKLPGGEEVVSVITKASAKSLGLKKGVEVVAVIKASDILVAVPCGDGDCECGE
jgi:molybdopterin-binding protein